jgi:hypothetical protein
MLERLVEAGQESPVQFRWRTNHGTRRYDRARKLANDSLEPASHIRFGTGPVKVKTAEASATDHGSYAGLWPPLGNCFRERRFAGAIHGAPPALSAGPMYEWRVFHPEFISVPESELAREVK